MMDNIDCKSIWVGRAMKIKALQHALKIRNQESNLIEMIQISDAQEGIMSTTKEFEEKYLKGKSTVIEGYDQYIADMEEELKKYQN